MATAIFIGAAMIAYAINPGMPIDETVTRMLLICFVVYDVFTGAQSKK